MSNEIFSRSNLAIDLQDLIQNKVLPDIRHSDPLRWVTAPRNLRDFKALPDTLPPGIRVSENVPSGPRTLVRRKLFAGRYHHRAYWPEDKLQEANIPVLMYVATGHADMKIGDYVLHMPHGSAFLIPAGVPFADGSEPHLCGQNAETGHCEIVAFTPLFADVEGLQFWVCSSRYKHHSSAYNPQSLFRNQSIAQCFQLLLQESSQSKVVLEVLRGLLLALFGLLLRELQAGRAQQVDEDVAAKRHAPPSGKTIARACENIRTGLGYPLHIDDVARSVYLSRTQFTRRFKSETGLTFVEFVTQERLKQARLFLAESDMPIEAVAQKVGLTSVRLRQLFHTHLQISPSEFRAKFQKE